MANRTAISRLTVSHATLRSNIILKIDVARDFIDNSTIFFTFDYDNEMKWNKQKREKKNESMIFITEAACNTKQFLKEFRSPFH